MERKAITMLALFEAKEAIKLYKKALDAQVLTIKYDPKTNYIAHAELLINNILIMLHDIRFQKKIMGAFIKKTPLGFISFYLKVPDQI